MKKITLTFYTFNILAHFYSFSWQIKHLENVDVYIWSEKVYVFNTYLNVNNYGWSPNIMIIALPFSTTV